MQEADASKVVDFWLDIGPDAWFGGDKDTDEKIRSQFLTLHGRAAAGELDSWRLEPRSCLALILVLDQFSRNLYRGQGQAFAQDAHARKIAAHAADNGYASRIDRNIAFFFFMPFMHSESIIDQNRCLKLLRALGSPRILKFAIMHRDVIRRFGRFPNRNAALGRHTTPREAEYLKDGGFG